MPQMEAPMELLMPLLPYQKEFLAWAIKQERSDVRGGCAPGAAPAGATCTGFCSDEVASGAAARPRAECVRWCKRPLT